MPKDDSLAGILFEIKGKLGKFQYNPNEAIVTLNNINFPNIELGFPAVNLEYDNGRGPRYYCRDLVIPDLNIALKSSTYNDMIICGYWVCRS